MMFVDASCLNHDDMTKKISRFLTVTTVQQNQQRLSRNWLVSCTVRRMPSATPSSSCQGAEFHHISKGPLDR